MELGGSEIMDDEDEQQVLVHHHQQQHQVILPMEDFQDDVELRLGRANGNIYHRHQGIEGIHDGQVMVRLKKKRYIVIDYSIIPNEHDLQWAATHPHITIPNGAGKQKCTTLECTKVGVPVCLYDSEPNEPISLYLRAGLCFTCQRNLNEKRRTQRKRPSNQHQQHNHNNMMHNNMNHTNGGMMMVHHGDGGVGVGSSSSTNPLLYGLGMGYKKIKLNNGMSADVNSDTIILNGGGQYYYGGGGGGTTMTTTNNRMTTSREGGGYGYSFDEIGPDLTAAVQEASEDTQRLVAHAISSNPTTTGMTAAAAMPVTSAGSTTTDAAVDAGTTASNHMLFSVEDVANAAVEATTGILGGGVVLEDDPNSIHDHHQQQPDDNSHRHHHHEQQHLQHQASNGATTSNNQNNNDDDVNVLYDKAFSSLSRSIFLLTQWKQTWDSAIAAAVAQETVGDPSSLADAVASAAAVAAAASDGTDNISLLLAADQRKEEFDDENDNDDNDEGIVGHSTTLHQLSHPLHSSKTKGSTTMTTTSGLMNGGETSCVEHFEV